MQPNPLSSLSRRERQIMDILYEHRECSAQDILKALPDPPSYSTVRALMARLLGKELVHFRQDGAKYIYFPAVEQTKVQESAIARLLKIFFRGSRAKAVNALLDAEGESLSKRELEEIERKIQRLKSVQDNKAQDK